MLLIILARRSLNQSENEAIGLPKLLARSCAYLSACLVRPHPRKPVDIQANGRSGVTLNNARARVAK